MVNVKKMVKDLKASDFYKNGKLKVSKHGMLLVYAEWCGHCSRFMPDFEKIDELTGDDYLCLKFQDIYLTSELSKKLQVRGFPTIKFFDSNGEIVSDFNGDRSIDNILKHICETYHYCVKNNR